MSRHRWTKAEDRRFKALLPLGMKELERAFDYLNRNQLRGRAWTLKLKVPRKGVIVRHRAIPIPRHAHPLVRILIEEANRQKCSITELAKRAGVSRKSISDWRYVKSPSLLNLIAVLNVLGKDLGIVLLKDDERYVDTVDSPGWDISRTSSGAMPDSCNAQIAR